MSQLIISAPGRICLFGDHQDYLGLPVIACAINRQVILSAEKNNESVFRILMPDISSERIIDISETFDILETQDYFASAIRVVRRYGCNPSMGYTLTLKSNIPINAGVSSSSAIVVAWVHFLLKAFGCDYSVNPPFIAQLAYEAEVVEHHSPGGRMDQYTSAIGNIIYIDTAQDAAFRTIGTSMEGLILAESGIPKQTLGVLSNLRGYATDAIETVSEKVCGFNIAKAKIEDYKELKGHLSEELQPYFYAAIKNHSITQEAITAFKNKPLDHNRIGHLMSEHHQVLKDVLKITVPRIDAMIDAAIKAGAYGAKIVGSGGGGSIAALAPPSKKLEVINAILESGAKDAYEVLVTQGTHSN
jgi:galactokinase